MGLFNIIALAEEETENSSGGGVDIPTIILLVVVGLALIVMLFVIPRLRGKRQAETVNTLRTFLQPGAVIKTIGGIIGKVTEVKQTPNGKVLVIETGEESNKTTLSFDIAALYAIVTTADGQKFVPTMLTKAKAATNETKQTTTVQAEDKSKSTDAFESNGDNNTEQTVEVSKEVEVLEASDDAGEVDKDKLVE